MHCQQLGYWKDIITRCISITAKKPLKTRNGCDVTKTTMQFALEKEIDGEREREREIKIDRYRQREMERDGEKERQRQMVREK